MGWVGLGCAGMGWATWKNGRNGPGLDGATLQGLPGYKSAYTCRTRGSGNHSGPSFFSGSGSVSRPPGPFLLCAEHGRVFPPLPASLIYLVGPGWHCQAALACLESSTHGGHPFRHSILCPNTAGSGWDWSRQAAAPLPFPPPGPPPITKTLPAHRAHRSHPVVPIDLLGLHIPAAGVLWDTWRLHTPCSPALREGGWNAAFVPNLQLGVVTVVWYWASIGTASTLGTIPAALVTIPQTIIRGPPPDDQAA